MNFIFWQNIPSIHQSALLRALASRDHCTVTLMVQEDIPEQRRTMGWTTPNFGDTKVIIAPSRPQADKFIEQSHRGDIHIFSGFRGYPFVKRALKKAIEKKHIIGVFSEPPDPRGLKGKIRYVIYKIQAWQYKQQIDFILATGNTAIEWFEDCGYSRQLIFPFGYFVETPEVIKNAHFTSNEKVHIIYVGSLIRCKAVDILIQVLSTINHDNWRLEIIGNGPEKNALQLQTKQAGISDKVHFHGNIANHSVIKYLYKSDLLVLPSRYDGWGAVINEALMAGVPVLCSDQCGAASLLDGKERGTVFPAGSSSALKKILITWILKGPRSSEEKNKLIHWAKKHVGGPIATDYLLQIIKHITKTIARPPAPWETKNKLKTLPQ